jgi:hypothetical protein
VYGEELELATPNYRYEKRQKALAKKKKQDEKRQRRLTKESPPSQDDLERPTEPEQKA